ncbi:MAG TPA: nucleotidyl transferase AbiEii/AbiGii toxin family protein [Thermoanaerobaculia bacterium]|nr:nucleotidyl transferase AbiEii/AbiGii toxin family protein [Thermoanaerobaculia bacterium]
MRLLARVVSKLEQMGAPCALIGGVALAFHGIDRATEDIDLLATEPSILNASLWEDLRSEGISVGVTMGDCDDPLRGVVRIDSTEVIDVVVPRGRWQDDVLARRLVRVILGERIPVVDAADLILLKIDAGGLIDLIDVELLMRHDPTLLVIVETRMEQLPRRMKVAWQEFLPRLGSTARAPE